ncbi:hypothetical protein 32HC_67 [Mycobacterium phage 32HC]|uniref:Uncharacterized protein n=1 Tax=Mycobacterium phage 32HC TaxID=1445729 RepID=W8EHE1_9CAUD|nr:replication initiation protein [Mycobacterium phage 32HC]AHJ86345.1 hypothetical protein 32HC_67 [Mycobacterium phage 32HC]
MPYFQLDDQFSDSKEVMALPRKYRLECVGLFALMGCWSANKLLDGFVPDEQIKQLGGRKILIDLLAGIAGPDGEDWSLIERISSPVSSGIRIKNWPKWQKTRAQVLEFRKAEAERKRREREFKKQRRNPTSSDNAEASGADTSRMPAETANSRPAGRPAGVRTPIPVPRPIPTEELTECAEHPVGSSSPNTHTESAPPKFCDRHPQGTRQRCGDCANARIVFQAWQTDRAEREDAAQKSAAASRAQSKALIDECPDCDPGGWLLDADGDPVEPAIRCDHLTTRRARNG